MSFKFFYKALFVFIIPAVAGCTRNPAPVVHTPLTLPEHAGQVIGAQNRFAFQFFRETLEKDQSLSNKLISPLSIYLALSMVYNGADGETQKAMQQTLFLENTAIELLNETGQSLINSLPKEDSKVSLDIANSIWYNHDLYQPLASFLHTSKEYYRAQLVSADFKDPATVKRINDWVSGETHQKIKKVLDQIDPTDLMFLINAIYFNGQWKFKFDKDKTKDRTFHTINGDVQTPFMTQKGAFNYGKNDSLQILELPYGAGDFNMYILLPDKSYSLRQMISSLNVNTFNDYLSTLDSGNLRIYLPKWNYRYEIKNMKPELTGLGMGIAFRPQADFTNMYPPEANAYISKAIHKTYIEVNEKGTEAAAVTVIGMAYATVGLPHQEFTMEVNRPFLYLITEKTSGAILFLGTVNDPK